MLGERAIDWGNLFQTDIVLVKKENLKKKIYLTEFMCPTIAPVR
jgi:hypothetical protein